MNYLSTINKKNLNADGLKLFSFLEENQDLISSVWFEFLFHILNNCTSLIYSEFVLNIETDKEKILNLISKNFYVEPFYFFEILGIEKNEEILGFFLAS